VGFENGRRLWAYLVVIIYGRRPAIPQSLKTHNLSRRPRAGTTFTGRRIVIIIYSQDYVHIVLSRFLFSKPHGHHPPMCIIYPAPPGPAAPPSAVPSWQEIGGISRCRHFGLSAAHAANVPAI
jgi:hypothetical protein